MVKINYIYNKNKTEYCNNFCLRFQNQYYKKNIIEYDVRYYDIHYKNKMIGVIQYGFINKKCYIHYIMILKQLRNKGFCDMVINDLKRKYKEIILTIADDDNFTKLYCLYKKLGFDFDDKVIINKDDVDDEVLIYKSK